MAASDRLGQAVVTAGAASFTVALAPGGIAFEAAPGQTLLQAALRAGIELPRMCRNGTCRSCLCVLLEGRVQHVVEWPGLSPDEKAAGFILPCVAVACTDLRLQDPRGTGVERGAG